MNVCTDFSLHMPPIELMLVLLVVALLSYGPPLLRKLAQWVRR